MLPILYKDLSNRANIDLTKHICIVGNDTTNLVFNENNSISIYPKTPIQVSMLNPFCGDHDRRFLETKLGFRIYCPRGIVPVFSHPECYSYSNVLPKYEKLVHFETVNDIEPDYISYEKISLRSFFHLLLMKNENPTQIINKEFPLGELRFQICIGVNIDNLKNIQLYYIKNNEAFNDKTLGDI